MSINDPWVPIYDEKHGWWMVMRGNETSYDRNRYLRTFKTRAAALRWIRLRSRYGLQRTSA